MPPRDWDAGEHTCTSKRQILPHHARLLSFHLVEQWKFKINQETNLQTEESECLTLFFSPEEASHCGFQCALQVIGKGMILSANNTGETLRGWKVPLSTQAWWEWLSEKTSLVPKEFVLQDSWTSSSSKWILAGWQDKMNFLSTSAARHTVFKFWYWEGQCTSNQLTARILLIPKTNMFSEKVCASAMNIW